MKVLKKVSLIALTLTIVILSVLNPMPTEVKNKNMAFEIDYIEVNRVEVLEKFFDKFNSPLKAHAKTFVEVSDKYKIDYMLLPSIACVESTCGKALIKGSYNPFGWGVYENTYIAFDSFDKAIEAVAEGLYEGYFSKGYDTAEEIAPIYTPPNANNWYRGVTWFTNQIELIALSS